ncbi:hypothetical protein CPSG_00360 [Coccidioides posadasii str. Silveira]|uniref:Uncharacterized protein n=1 Tax=Coccidioides posadasii (strain RMSCC 757 / Silveira) TaxID=443226 RepID=E9CRN4_COCPS|nr:hypothetical protein CPSG_00360 [Coccidioides posadasii str. Silveira]
MYTIVCPWWEKFRAKGGQYARCHEAFQRCSQGFFEDLLGGFKAFLNIHRANGRVGPAVFFTPRFNGRRELSSIRLELEFVVFLAVLALDDSIIDSAHAVFQQVRRLLWPNGRTAGNSWSEKLPKVCWTTDDCFSGLIDALPKFADDEQGSGLTKEIVKAYVGSIGSDILSV